MLTYHQWSSHLTPISQIFFIMILISSNHFTRYQLVKWSFKNTLVKLFPHHTGANVLNVIYQSIQQDHFCDAIVEYIPQIKHDYDSRSSSSSSIIIPHHHFQCHCCWAYTHQCHRHPLGIEFHKLLFWGPFHKRFFHHNSNLMEILF